MRKIVLVLFVFHFAIRIHAQKCSSAFDLFILPKSIKTSIRVTESSIKNHDTDTISISESENEFLLDRIIEFLPKDDSQLLQDFKAIDVRFLLDISDSCEVRTIAFSRNGLLAVDGSRIYKYEPDSIINLLKHYIPPNLEWYDVDPAVLRDYQMKKMMGQLEKGN